MRPVILQSASRDSELFTLKIHIKVAEEKKSIDTGDVKAAEIEPTCTLYIRKLNDKVKIEEMRACLYHMFNAYGAESTS